MMSSMMTTTAMSLDAMAVPSMPLAQFASMYNNPAMSDRTLVLVVTNNKDACASSSATTITRRGVKRQRVEASEASSSTTTPMSLDAIDDASTSQPMTDVDEAPAPQASPRPPTTLHVSSIVLAANSVVFKTMLTGLMKEAKDNKEPLTVHVTDEADRELHVAMIRFFYTGNLPLAVAPPASATPCLNGDETLDTPMSDVKSDATRGSREATAPASAPAPAQMVP